MGELEKRTGALITDSKPGLRWLIDTFVPLTPTSDGSRSRCGHTFAVMSFTRKGAGPVQTLTEENQE